MKIKMKLISDTVFGNGVSVPGGEDISVNHDEKGFPFYSGSALKGVLREALENYLAWTDMTESVDDIMDCIRCTDMELSEEVRTTILSEMRDCVTWQEILDLFSYLRTFTAIGDDGAVKDGSLRSCRCIISDLVFYGEIECKPEWEDMIREVLPMIQYIGSMRTRGFGNVSMIGKGE